MVLNTNLFYDTVTIQRHSASGVDARGNLTSDWQDNQTNVNCRIISSGSIEDRDGRNTVIESIIIYFDDKVNIKASDRIKKSDTEYYEIVGVNLRKDAKGQTCYTIVEALNRE